MSLKLAVLNKKNSVICEAESENRVTLVHKPHYHKGDKIVFTAPNPGFYELRLEDTLPPTIVYVEKAAAFHIPFGTMERVSYPPRSFKSVQHLITASIANPAIVNARRNLCLNPLDQHGDTGMYPHAVANVETRKEALFAARNAIDGIYANHKHYPFPYQSWGINKDPNAELSLEFGTSVTLDEIILTLRADYPHDSYWTKATVIFSDGSREILHLVKSDKPQVFPITPRTVTGFTLKELIKATDDSPFPALTQIEAWGIIAR